MQSPGQLPNFLTFDVEEYYEVNYQAAGARPPEGKRTNLPELLDGLLGLCAESGIRCTFFILGKVGKLYPEAVRRIHAAGHEVASHGFAHEPVHELTPQAFQRDLERSTGLLESLVGEKVAGYRAPSFSVTREILPWFYESLELAGLKYSSSVFPGRTFLYGIPDFPRRVHRPVIDGRKTSIIEFPMPRMELLGKTIGVYVRLLTAGMLRSKIARENRAGRPAVLYVHPREIDPGQPRLPLSRMQSLIHYWGLRGCEAKLRKLLGTAPLHFTRMRDTLSLWEDL